MASETAIVNAGLTLLGETRIMSLDDDIRAARDAKAIFTIARDALLAGYTWSFAKARTQLSSLVDTDPTKQYALIYQLPSDCLRLVMVGDHYLGLDLTDYRGSPVEEFVIEGRQILTNLSAPLNIKYVKRVTDTAQFSPNFTMAFSARIAADLAESLTQSSSKREVAEARFQREINLAIRAGAIELPPTKLPDDEWLISRL